MNLKLEKRQPKTSRYTVRFAPSERKVAEAAASEAGVPLSEFVRAATRRAAREVVAGEGGGE